MSTTQTICVRFETAIFQHLKQVARLQSVESQTNITVSDIVREAVLRAHPMPDDEEKEIL